VNAPAETDPVKSLAVDVTEIIRKLRANPVLKSEELQRMTSDALKTMGGASNASFKKLKQAIDAQMSLTDITKFFSADEMPALGEQGITAPTLQALLTELNSMTDKKDIKARMKKAIDGSAHAETMTSFAMKYFRKRFSARWV